MNIGQIIKEEVNTVLQEQEDQEVIGALEQIAQGAPGVLPDLEKFVNSNITKFLQKQLASASQIKEVSSDDLEQKIAGGIESGIGVASGVAKGVAKGVGKGVVKPAGIPAAKLVGHIGSYLPFGKKLGILIAAAQDKSVDKSVRNAIYFALGNLVAGSMGLDLPDLGNLIQQIPEIAWESLPFTDNDQNWDWGVLDTVDDAALLGWAYRKMTKAGIDPKDQLKRFAEFIGRAELIPKGAGDEDAGAPAAAGAPRGAPGREDMSLDAKIARAREARRKGEQYRSRGKREGLKLKKSALYQIIQEEVEVVLTNSEAVEFFDLDMSKLLDEMMDEGLPFMQDVERAQAGELPPGQASRIQGASDAMKTRAGDPSRTSQGPTAITRSPTGAEREAPEAGEEETEELQEKEDKSFSKAGEEIEKKGTEGVFTAKADKAGMGVQAYADKVLQKDSKASTKTKRQAAFAKGAATVARENK